MHSTAYDSERAGRLAAGAAELGVPLPDDAIRRLLDLLTLLARWNRAYNLTAVDDPDEALAKHVLDSLAAVRAVDGLRVLDVGTGAGFPGLPFAIARPDWHVTLLDSHRKKLRFVEQAAAELGLDNVDAVHSRAEDFRPQRGFDTVACRALAPLAQFIGWAGHLAVPGGRLLALKARLGDDELAALPDRWQAQCEPVVVPFLDGRRTLVVLTRRDDPERPGART